MKGKAVTVKLTVLDIEKARRYLRGLASLCREGSTGSPAVLLLALRVLALQGETVNGFLEALPYLNGTGARADRPE